MPSSIQTLPFILLAVTLVLWIPHRFVKSRKNKYVEEMKKTVWIETIDNVTHNEIRSAMVEADKVSNTTQIREETYNFFAEEFVKAYTNFLNESTLSKQAKVRKLSDAKSKLTMKFTVDALEKIDEAIDKLEGNVTI